MYVYSPIENTTHTGNSFNVQLFILIAYVLHQMYVVVGTDSLLPPRGELHSNCSAYLRAARLSQGERLVSE